MAKSRRVSAQKVYDFLHNKANELDASAKGIRAATSLADRVAELLEDAAGDLRTAAENDFYPWQDEDQADEPDEPKAQIDVEAFMRS